MSRPVSIKIPASTSNLGSGFDTLGLALQLYNHLTMRPLTGKGIEISSQHPSLDLSMIRPMVQEAAATFFREARVPARGFQVEWKNNIPIARGLGFSSTVRAGIVAGLNALFKGGLSKTQILNTVTRLEGHPDNATPSILGGFTVSGSVETELRVVRFPVPNAISFVTLIPKKSVVTKQARALLPKHYPAAVGAHALNRAALITACFAGRHFEKLAGLFDDQWHQPYRETLVPELFKVIRAAEKAGAIGGFLSGSGSAIICVASRQPDKIARAMQRSGDGEVLILKADNQGMRCRYE